MKGTVYKSTGNWYTVKLETGEKIDARIKGIFRLDNTRTTNPIAVGDQVTLSKENHDWQIAGIDKRTNYIIRVSPKNRTARHILASNIDQVCIMATLAKPRTSSGFIDRCLVTAEAYHIPSVVIFNKIDLYKHKEEMQLQELVASYEKAGIQYLKTSVLSKINMSQFQHLLENKITLLIGHSGVGKSSLLNAIDPTLNLRTGEISETHEKGKHTTTFAEMCDLSFGGSIIDTPGIKEFGLLDIEKNELSHCFPEMVKVLHECKFNNCLHVAEPDCAVVKAVQAGVINEGRYLNYLNMLEDLDESIEKWELK